MESRAGSVGEAPVPARLSLLCGHPHARRLVSGWNCYGYFSFVIYLTSLWYAHFTLNVFYI